MSGLDGLGWPTSDDTPETDWRSFAIHGTRLLPGTQYVDTDFARKLERERNAALAVISAIEERYIDGCDTYGGWKFMGDTARAFLSENAQCPSTGATEKAK